MIINIISLAFEVFYVEFKHYRRGIYGSVSVLFNISVIANEDLK